MLSHTRNRQSRWTNVTEAFEAVAAKAKPKRRRSRTQSQSQTHLDSRHVADEKWHVKRHKSLIRNANWTNKTIYSISIVTYNGIRTTLLYIIRIWYTILFGSHSNVHDSYIGRVQEFGFNGGWFKPIRVAFYFIIQIFKSGFLYSNNQL